MTESFDATEVLEGARELALRRVKVFQKACDLAESGDVHGSQKLFEQAENMIESIVGNYESLDEELSNGGDLPAQWVVSRI
ncbi:hypothetical protein [Amycolatopsis minnesotensis]|uniref:Uncharacterized protein n=1 Tax=Amycolatopsis minnesotensis TaxID=337894 RepID=A0ABN2Q330_9PSEU